MVRILINFDGEAVLFDSKGMWSISNTMYPSKSNCLGIIDKLISHHARSMKDERLTSILFDVYRELGNSKGMDDFNTTYRVLFHSWALYQIIDDKLFLTPLALELHHARIEYQEFMRIICSRFQLPKPQLARNPEGPVRPMVELVRAILLIKKESDHESSLSVSEMNLFCSVLNTPESTITFVNMVVAWRDGRWTPPSELKLSRTNNKRDLLKPMSVIIKYLEYANYVEKEVHKPFKLTTN